MKKIFVMGILHEIFFYVLIEKFCVVGVKIFYHSYCNKSKVDIFHFFG